jgi:cell pole-organizing protein PopZ
MGDINRDPSMEEILASIKRVIAEDGRAAMASSRSRGARPAPGAIPPIAPEDDVLELNDPVSDEDGIMSDGAAEASRQALAALAAMNQDEAPAAPAAAGDGPLEAAVKDMLRPMLKAWLDEHLPEMVEELVTREIARITGKHFR